MLETGSVAEGKVIRIMPFGAFVEVGRKNTGLVHISEISESYVRDINDCLKIGDKVRVKVIGFDEKGRMALSIKQAAADKTAQRAKKKQPEKKESVRPADVDLFSSPNDSLSFEDKLSRFKKDSDEKILALKRSAEGKRSGGYSRRR